MDVSFFKMEALRGLRLVNNFRKSVLLREDAVLLRARMALFCNDASILAIPVGSGQTWTSSVLNCYLNFLYNQKFDGVYMSGFDVGRGVGVKFVPPATWSNLGSAIDLKRLDSGSSVSFIFGGHPKYSSLPFVRPSGITKVFVTRGLLSAIYAKTKKYYSKKYNGEKYIQDPSEYNLDRFREVMREEVVGHYFKFYNEWGMFLRNRGSLNAHFFRFEDLKGAPEKGFEEILALLLRSREINKEYLCKSVAQADLDTVKKNYSRLHGKKETFYVGNRGAVSYNDEMPDDIKSMIVYEIDKGLRYADSFPYDLC